MQAFRSSINASVETKANISGSAEFEATLKHAASQNSVSLELQYDTTGDASDITFDTNDVVGTFNLFRAHVKPAPSTVFLRHYSTIESKIRAEIPMRPDLYRSLCNVFSDARFALVLNSLAPGSTTTRILRNRNLLKLYREIYSRRLEIHEDESALGNKIQQLTTLIDELLLLIDRQELVTTVRGYTYEDICRYVAYMPFICFFF